MRRAAVLTGLVCMLVGAFLDRRGLGGWDLGTDLDRLTAGACAVFAAAGLLSLALSRNARILGAICAAAAVVPGVLAVTDAVESGLPGPSTGVLAVGSAVVVLGTVARAFERDGARPGGNGGARRLRVALIAAVAVAGTAAAALAAAVVVVEAPVRSSTAAAADPAPVVQRAAGVRWEWEAEGAVREVRAAGAGVVVAGQDGVTALDGVSGVPRWAFARAGTRLADLVVSPDRRSVVVAHVGSASSVAVVTALDALTGERRWETALDGRPDLLVTDTVVALARDEERETGSGKPPLRAAHLAAHDIATGAPAWRFHDLQVDSGAAVPLGLLPGDPLASLDNLRDAFVVPAPGAVVVAVATGWGSVVGLA